MKVLFIAIQFPYPLDTGSKIRSFNILRTYALKYEVTLLCFIRPKGELEYMSEVKKYCKQIYTVPIQTSFWHHQNKNKVIRFFLRLFSPFPYCIKLSYSLQMVNLLERIKLEKYDIIHIQYLLSMFNIRKILRHKNRRFKLILDIDDYESKKRYREFKLLKFSREKILIFLEYLKWRLLEKKILPQFDCCLVCSKSDKLALMKAGLGENIYVLPNAVNLDNYKLDGVLEEHNRILYLGAMDYEPNSDAVLYFCKEIFPHIKKAVPNIQFIIAGKCPSSEVSRLNNGVDIFVNGYIYDVKKEISKSSLFIVPLRLGGGTRIKILEALVLKKAIVSTSVGCEGIEVTSGKNIIISDIPIGFAKECVELLENKYKRKLLGEEGQQLIREKYSWDIVGEHFLNFISTI